MLQNTLAMWHCQRHFRIEVKAKTWEWHKGINKLLTCLCLHNLTCLKIIIKQSDTHRDQHFIRIICPSVTLQKNFNTVWFGAKSSTCPPPPLLFSTRLPCPCTFKKKKKWGEGARENGEKCSGRERGREREREAVVMFSCVFFLWEVAQPHCCINTHMHEHMPAHVHTHTHTHTQEGNTFFYVWVRVPILTQSGKRESCWRPYFTAVIPSCSADREEEGTAQRGSETLRDGQEETVTWVKNLLDRMNKVDGKVWLRRG